MLDGTVEKVRLQDFAAKVKQSDIVTISVHSGMVSLNAELNIRLIKRINPEVTVIVGGHHASLYAREWLDKGSDFVVRGEGEITFKELIEALSLKKDFSTIDGITYKREGTIIENKDRSFIDDLDKLPMPRWRLIHFDRYYPALPGGGFPCTIETSRGCTSNCHFCLVPVLWKRTQRFKSVEKIIEELKAVKRLSVSKVYFADDNFGAHYERDMALCRAISQEKLNMQWICFSRADYILQHPDLYESASRAGLRAILAGYETINEQNIPLFNKSYTTPMSLKRYQDVYDFCRKNQIFVLGLFIIGYPLETVYDIKNTLAYHHLVCDYPLLTPFRPAKKTKSYEMIKDNIAGDIFYFDSQVNLIKFRSTQTLHRNKILQYLFHPKTILKVFSKNPFHRFFFKTHYRFLLRNLISVDILALKNVLYLLIASRKGYSFYRKYIIEKLLRRYDNFRFR